MPNFLVNGVPLFTPGRDGRMDRGWLRTDDPHASFRSLRDLSRRAEEVFGIGLRSGLLDLLELLESGRVPQPVTQDGLARALAAETSEVAAIVGALALRGLVRVDADTTAVEPTDKPPLALAEFAELVDRAFVSRRSLRDALLLRALDDGAALDADVQRVFDRFFDLGWLYLHNWGSVCTTMAALVAEALRLEGHDVRIQHGSVHVERDGSVCDLGAQGAVPPGQFDGHVFCIVDDSAVVDFGLGNMRRGFRRDSPWAVALRCRPEGSVIATLDHPQAGRMQWRTDWQSPAGPEELRAAPLAAELMQVYALRRAGAKDGPAASA